MPAGATAVGHAPPDKYRVPARLGTGAVRRLQAMAKPSGAPRNLDGTYCSCLSKHDLPAGPGRGAMDCPQTPARASSRDPRQVVLPPRADGQRFLNLSESLRMRAASALICASALLLAGCASIGPPTVVRDRFDYVSALSDSWKRQTLLNLLKIRYADAPVFLDVTSVISAYSVGADVSVGGEIARPGRGDTFASVGAGAQYADKPTITYQPLSGDKFARSLMAPIPISALLSLIQAGYPADLVLRICVNSINGIENDFGGPGNPRVGSPKFYELMTALRQSQAAGGSGFRTRSTKDKQTVVMFLRPSSEDAVAPSTGRIRELLGLDPAAREFTVVYGSFSEPDGDIAILSRSVLQIMIDFAAQIDVPASDVAEGRVYRPERTAEQERMFPPLLKVRTGASPPEDAHAAVRYREQWFWIDDRDQPSKRALTLIMMVFSLTESAPSQAAPLVTIPAR